MLQGWGFEIMSEKEKNMVYDTAWVAFIALEKKKTKVTDQK